MVLQAQPLDVKRYSAVGTHPELVDAHAFAVQYVSRQERFETQVTFCGWHADGARTMCGAAWSFAPPRVKQAAQLLPCCSAAP
jgi:hypothetical protein